MSTMAEVLWGKRIPTGGGTDYIRLDANAAHAIAAELAAAGYGNMADAWDEGHGIGCVDQILTVANGEQCDTPNPYRGAGHE